MPKRWISDSQLRQALDALTGVHPYFGMTFLAFKALPLSVGHSQHLRFSAVMREFLQRYYRPSATYSGYYNPFLTSNPSNRWVTNKYPSGALQRIAVDTFGDAIIHTKRQSQWGWRIDYVDVLAELQARTSKGKIPAFHLAVWLYRDRPALPPDELLGSFLADFNIEPREHTLFDLEGGSIVATSDAKVSERSLLRLIGWPPGETSGDSITVSSVEMTEVGPAQTLNYQPAERLNLITGDNSLGKTFLLECVWWTITGHWSDYVAEPRRHVSSGDARMEYTLNASGRQRRFAFGYDPAARSWLPTRRPFPPAGGLAIYCRHDGAHLVWDPVSLPRRSGSASDGVVALTREELLRGKQGRNERGQQVSVCNGLLADWIDWQTRKSQFDDVFDTFRRCLRILSPPGGERLRVGEPTQMLGDEREMPTLRATYGVVPFVYASAGVQRIVGLLYAVIWAWFRHQRNAKLTERVPQDCLILMVDELEAHLHPRWQRSIVPSLISAVESLAGEVTMQLHFATHSPLVLASAEPLLAPERDCLHHLEIGDETVSLEQVDCVRLGTVDSWLESGVFGLKQARSLGAEKAIERAKGLQVSRTPERGEVLAVDRELAKLLRDDDEFWPRWRYFARGYRGGKS